ncbi:AAA family ATPase [Streptomyces sp. NBC_01298]|uniref:AAA family ATPase n=1 Tax=Streptomyces sp. NBC_01298 TaxID=2903817 RepID=UPI002E13E958|nr:AAA family ATPase [Streptomyces sp. NBC_01298]
MEELGGSIRRRRLIVVAVDGYEESPVGFDEAIAAQVERITGWLADPELDAQRRFEVSRAPSVRSAAELREFLRKEDLAAASYRDAVVVYITGHGMQRGAAHRHFLMLPETKPNRLFATAFPTSELITEVLDSHSEHVLVLVDSCFSGILDAELTGLLLALSEERRNLTGAAVVTAGDYDEQPLVGSFTERVALACARMRDEAAGFTASHLSFAEWAKLLDDVGRDAHGIEKDLVDAEWVVPRKFRHGPSACLPNPRYRAPVSTVAPALRQLALPSMADVPAEADAADTDTGTDAALTDLPIPGSLDDFWIDRASGRAADDDMGWYFSGRTAQMTRLTGFLRGSEEALVVTGAAGSGKSALLARLVTLSDPGFVADPRNAAVVADTPAGLRPEPGSVDVAVLARNKPAQVIVRDLLNGLDTRLGSLFSPEHWAPAPSLRQETAPPLQALLQRVLDRATAAVRPVVVVIDALDEADDPLAVFNDVILPLARLRGPGGGRLVRLLLGIRSSPDLADTADAAGADLRDDRADHLLLRLTEALKAEGLTPGLLRSDGPDCTVDIAAYAATLLLQTAGSPYQGAPEEAAEAAGVIADAVKPSFLDARIAADQLRRAETRQALAEEGWLSRLAMSTIGLLREDIRDVSRATDVPAALLVAALRATAFAPGAGLPWAEVWPAVTRALAGSEYGVGHVSVSVSTARDAVRTLRDSRLTGYLATAEEEARTVYRPVHQRLTDLLIADPSWLLTPASAWASPSATGSPLRFADTGPEVRVRAHASIARALATLVEDSRPHPAHPYIRRHFLHHTAAGEVLDDLHVSLDLLAQETSGSLRTRLGLPLPTADPSLLMLTAAALIEPYVDETVDAASRAGSIAFQRGVRDGSWEGPAGLPAFLAWGRWAARVNVLAPTRGSTRSLCVLPTLDGRELIAVLSAAGNVRIWDSTTGRLAAEVTAEPAGAQRSVHGMCPILATGGRTFLVTWHREGVTIHDPGSGHPITAMSLPEVHTVRVLEEGAARWKLLVLTPYGSFLWKPSSRGTGPGSTVKTEGIAALSREDGASAIVVRRASGHALVAIPSPEGIRLCDPLSGPVADLPFGDARARPALVVSRPGEDDLLVIFRGRVGMSLAQVWNPFLGEQVLHARIMGRSPIALPDGKALASVDGNRIVMRDLDGSGGKTLDAEVPSVQALAVLDADSGVRFVSAGPQGIRLWDLRQDTPLYEDGLAETLYDEPRGWSGRRRMWPLCRAGHPGTEGAREVVVLGARDKPGTGGVPDARLQRGAHGFLELRDAMTGRLVTYLNTGPVLAVETIPSPAGTAYVSVEGRESWSVWDLVSGKPVLSVASRPTTYSSMCFITTPDGMPMAVWVNRNRIFRVLWDLIGGADKASSFFLNHDIGEPDSLTPVPSPDGVTTAIAAVGRRGITLIDLTSEKIVTTLRPQGRTGTRFLRPCVFGTHDRMLLASATSTDIQLWDTADGSPVAHWNTPDTLALAAIPLDDGRTLLASGDQSGVRIWDPLTGELRHTLLTGAPVHALAVGTGPTGPALHVHGPAGLATLTLDPRLL